jgi:hypothetical protein
MSLCMQALSATLVGLPQRASCLAGRPSERLRSFHSLVALQEAINRYLAGHNRDPRPFEVLRRQPETTISGFGATRPFKREEDRTYFAESLRLAGLPGTSASANQRGLCPSVTDAKCWPGALSKSVSTSASGSRTQTASPSP